jgi:hypothetical protein
MTHRWKIALLGLGLAINITGLVFAVIQSNPLLGLVNGTGVGFWTFNIFWLTKERRRADRSAARDRDYPYAGASLASFAAGGPIPGSLITSGSSLRFNVTPFGHPSPPEPGIKESTSEIPILAYKVARLIWLPNQGPSFAPLNHASFYGAQIAYGADADARCLADPTFRSYGRSFAPTPHGPCPSLNCSCGFYACTDLDMLQGGEAILEVELSGRVIVCEHGYRAGHQRVIRAHLRGCFYCGRTPSTASFEPKGELLLRCATHADATPSVPIADLTDLLGVPVDVDSSVRAEVTS